MTPHDFSEPAYAVCFMQPLTIQRASKDERRINLCQSHEGIPILPYVTQIHGIQPKEAKPNTLTHLGPPQPRFIWRSDLFTVNLLYWLDSLPKGGVVAL